MLSRHATFQSPYGEKPLWPEHYNDSHNQVCDVQVQGKCNIKHYGEENESRYCLLCYACQKKPTQNVIQPNCWTDTIKGAVGKI